MGEARRKRVVFIENPALRQASADLEHQKQAEAMMYLSSAFGTLELLKRHESRAPNSARMTALEEAEKALTELMYKHYPKAWNEYDVVRLGHRFFARMQTEFEILINSGELEQYTRKERTSCESTKE